MITTDKKTCNELALLLDLYGVRHAVFSPGSRNTPLIMAINRMTDIKGHSVIDERSAAFIALGLALASETPVAIICTSGSALLNYAPAIAEAFYSQIPLIVISADRPAERIGQDDGQTIIQANALKNFTKYHTSIPDKWHDETEHSFINRKINEALTSATYSFGGPVHINVEITEPLNRTEDLKPYSPRLISRFQQSTSFSNDDINKIARSIEDKKILVAIGPMKKDSDFCQTMIKLAENLPVLAEGTSNVKGGNIISDIDEYILSQDIKEPDIVITFGGGLTSRLLKEKIRSWNCEHWLVGYRDQFADCFGKLTQHFPCSNSEFANALFSLQRNKKALKTHLNASIFDSNAAWSDFKACSYICSQVPDYYAVHLSNGMVLRYCQNRLNVNVIHCNRGVNGIDGCASTAVGYSAVNQHDTLLITGDMCLQYDIAALSSALIGPKLKIIVICNGDGGIFRCISATKDVDELNEYISPKVNLPIHQLADAYGFTYFEATDFESLKISLKLFFDEHSKPAILAVKTDSPASAKVWLDYLEYFKNKKL